MDTIFFSKLTTLGTRTKEVRYFPGKLNVLGVPIPYFIVNDGCLMVNWTALLDPQILPLVSSKKRHIRATNLAVAQQLQVLAGENQASRQANGLWQQSTVCPIHPQHKLQEGLYVCGLWSHISYWLLLKNCNYTPRKGNNA